MQTNKLVTIFGASGFLGRHTVHALAKAGWRIRAVCRRPNLANYLVPNGSVGQIQLFRGNIHDDESVAKAVEGADVVLNLTGVLFGHGENSFDGIHEEAARRIAKAAKAFGVAAFVHVSAIGADPASDSGYASSKGRGERAVREEFSEAVIFRPSVLFGPEDKFFNKFAAMARYLPFLPLIGGGRTRLQPAYVGDVAAAIRLSLADEASAGKTFELGGPSVYTFRELMQYILRETGRTRLLLPEPFFLASTQAFFLQIPSMILPISPLLTMDQVRLLKHDNVVAGGTLTFADIGITPQSVEAVVPSYLWRFHPKGQFGAPNEALNHRV